MRKYLTVTRLLAAVFAITMLASVPFSAFAQVTVTPAPAATTQPVSGSGQVPTTGSVVTDAASTAALQTISPVLGSAVAASGGSISSVAGGVADVFNCVITGPVSCLINTIAYVILQFSNLLLGLAGTLFNWVVVKTVFGFSTFLGNSPGLLLAWRILRDIGNMFLLFGFIFLGLAVILDISSQTYAAKKTIPRLIIFAILMNFSLFAAQAVIDTSNVLSSVLYNQANNDPCPYDANAAPVGGNTTGAINQLQSNDNCFINAGLAGAVMQATGVSRIFQVEARDGGNNYNNAIVLIMLALFATIAAVVMFAGSLMLVSRAVVLVFLMISAPLGFAALAIPPLNDYGKKWWNHLLHQSFFAPVYLLLLLISLKITEGFTDGGLGATGSLAGALTQPNSSTMGIFLVFALVIGFMIASLIAAKKFGAAGASFAIKTAGNLTYGSIGFMGRRTIGQGSSALAKAIGKTERGRKTWYGNLAYDIAKKGGKSSFDVRKATPAKTAIKAAGLDLGEPSKAAAKGYEGEVEEKQKKIEARAAGFALNKEEQAAVDAAKKEVEKEKSEQSERDRKAKNDQISARTQNEAELKPRRDKLRDIEQEIQRARARGDELSAKSLEESLATEQRQYEIIERAGLERIKALERAAEEARKDSAEKVAKLEAEVKRKENKPKTDYADSLQKRSKSIVGTVMPVSRDANAKAAKKIREDMNKSKTQMALEKLEASVKSAGGKEADLDDVKKAVHEEEQAHSPRPKPGSDAKKDDH